MPIPLQGQPEIKLCRRWSGVFSVDIEQVLKGITETCSKITGIIMCKMYLQRRSQTNIKLWGEETFKKASSGGR